MQIKRYRVYFKSLKTGKIDEFYCTDYSEECVRTWFDEVFFKRENEKDDQYEIILIELMSVIEV